MYKAESGIYLLPKCRPTCGSSTEVEIFSHISWLYKERRTHLSVIFTFQYDKPSVQVLSELEVFHEMCKIPITHSLDDLLACIGRHLYLRVSTAEMWVWSQCLL